MKYFASWHTFHNANHSLLLKSCHGLERSLAAMQPQILMWCLFSAILLPCLNVFCVSFFLAPFFSCPVGVHFACQYLVTQPGHCRGLWARSLAQMNSKLTTYEWRVEVLPALHSAPGALGCVPPQQAGRTTTTRLQDKLHPEITRAQAGWSALQSP